MSGLINGEHVSHHDTSTRSNATSTHSSQSLAMREMLQILQKPKDARRGLVDIAHNSNNQQTETTLHQRTQGWVHGSHGYSCARGQAQKRRDSIDKQLRAVDTLARELSRKSIGGEAKSKSKSAEDVKREPKCHALQFVGRWTNELDIGDMKRLSLSI